MTITTGDVPLDLWGRLPKQQRTMLRYVASYESGYTAGSEPPHTASAADQGYLVGYTNGFNQGVLYYGVSTITTVDVSVPIAYISDAATYANNYVAGYADGYFAGSI